MCLIPGWCLLLHPAKILQIIRDAQGAHQHFISKNFCHDFLNIIVHPGKSNWCIYLSDQKKKYLPDPVNCSSAIMHINSINTQPHLSSNGSNQFSTAYYCGWALKENILYKVTCNSPRCKCPCWGQSLIFSLWDSPQPEKTMMQVQGWSRSICFQLKSICASPVCS